MFILAFFIVNVFSGSLIFLIFLAFKKPEKNHSETGNEKIVCQNNYYLLRKEIY